MELRTLTYFAAVCEHGTVSAAAEALHLTQPALSRQISALERELRLSLFERQGGRLHPTAAGREFLTRARAVIESARQAQEAAATLASGQLSHVTLGAPTTTLADVVAPFIATFTDQDPLPSVTSLYGPRALEALDHGTDLALVTRPPATRWASLQVAALPIYAYAPPGHALSGTTSVGLKELAGHRLLLLEPHLRPREILDEALASASVLPGDTIECGDAHVAQALAAAGRGVAVVSDDPRFGLAPTLIETAAGPLAVRLWAAWNPDHHAAQALAALAQRLRDFCGERYGEQVLPGRGA